MLYTVERLFVHGPFDNATNSAGILERAWRGAPEVRRQNIRVSVAPDSHQKGPSSPNQFHKQQRRRVDIERSSARCPCNCSDM